ncbi:MAG: CHASE domain-containing protein, partial [Spirochaetes bacterium]|nr:CHASE domain-containing protein [Spirochaetota bacterium]
MTRKADRYGKPSRARIGFLPIVLFSVFCFLTFLISRSLRNHEARDLADEVALASAALAGRIDADLRGRLPSLRRIADRWAVRGGTPEREFLLDAAAYIADQPGYQALEWVDADFTVRWVVPLEGNEPAVGQDLRSEARRRAALEAAESRRVPTSTAPVDLVQGGKGFLVCFPIHDGDTFDGFILAVFRMEDWLASVLAGGGAIAEGDYDISISFDGVPAYAVGGDRTGTESAALPSATSEAGILGRSILVSVRPTPERAAASRTGLPAITVSLGLAFSFLIAFVTRLLGATRAEARIIDQARIKLEHEVAERERIAAALRMREQQVRLLLDSTAEAIFGIDLNGECTFANPACLRMLGYADAEDLIGENMHRLAHHSKPDGSPLDEASCGMLLAIRDGAGVHRADEVMWRADGKSFPVEYWSYPEVRDGAILGAVVT